MELSVREAATLLGRSPRTVRAQLARGELPGIKKKGRWRLDRRQLPLTEAQHRALQGKAQDVRDAVEDVLPSRAARHSADRTKSVVDLEAFRAGASVLRALESSPDGVLPVAVRRRARRWLEEALLALSEAVLQFDRRMKLEALHRSRAQVARVVGLLAAAEAVPSAPVLGWIRQLEGEVAGGIGGLARWVDRLQGRRS